MDNLPLRWLSLAAMARSGCEDRAIAASEVDTTTWQSEEDGQKSDRCKIELVGGLDSRKMDSQGPRGKSVSTYVPRHGVPRHLRPSMTGRDISTKEVLARETLDLSLRRDAPAT